MSTTSGRRRTPRLTKTEMAAWRDTIELTSALRRTFERELQQTCGLSNADYAVLLSLVEAEDRRRRSSVLAHRIGWDRSRVSHHIGRMEKRGLVTREAADSDSRGAYVVLTEAGYQAIRTATPHHFAQVRFWFLDALSPEQIAALGEIMQTAKDHYLARQREIYPSDPEIL